MSVFLVACVFALAIYAIQYGALWVQDRRHMANQSLRWFIASLAVWVTGELLQSYPFMRGHLLTLERLQVFGWGTSTFFFLSFAFAFLERRRRTGFYGLAAATAVAVVLGSTTNLVFDSLKQTGTIVVGLPGVLFWPVVGLVLWNGAAALTLLFQALVRESEQRVRVVLAAVVVGGALTLIVAGTTDVLLPYVLKDENWPQFGCTIGTLFCAVVTVAMMRHDFLSTTVGQIAEELFSRSGEGIALIDAEQMVRRINPAAGAMLGLPTSGGPWVAQIVLPGYEPTESFAHKEIHLETAGQQRVVSLSQSTHEGADTGYATVLVYRDITEDRRIEKRLEEERGVLEKEVARRTAELEQTRAKEVLGAVASGVIHDFNNQLFPIISIAELVREDLPDEHPARSDIDEIIRAGNQAAEVGKQLLGFTRKIEARKGLVDLAQLTRDVHRLIESSAKKNAKLPCYIEVEPASVLGSTAQMRQALVNIATNALEAIGDSGGTVELRLWQSNDAISRRRKGTDPFPLAFVVTVSDNGPGIATQNLAQVFAPFYTTKGGLGRSGLGLTVAAHIAEQHNGTIDISSEPGQGTKVSLVLPSLARPSWISEVQSAPELFGRERILLVGSSSADSIGLDHVLAPLGFQLVTVDSAIKAHRVLRSDPAYYDLLIIDADIEEDNIRELVETAGVYRPDLALLVVGGTSGTETLARRAGKAVMRLDKGVSRLELARAVREVLRART